MRGLLKKTMAAIGVEATYEAIRREFIVTTLYFFVKLFFSVAQGTPHDRVLDFILSIAWDTGAKFSTC